MQAPNLFLSFAAGILSFLSPCILPMIPSYITFIGGMTLTDVKEAQGISKRSLIYKTLFFVGGFSLVFVLLGVIFSGSGFLFSGASKIINIVAGIIVIILGLNIIFNFWKFLNYEKKVHFKGSPKGYPGSLLMGMAFGAGWSPCIGPILAGILFLAGTSGKVLEGVLYLSAYSVGLGIPFLLVAVFFSPMLERIKQFSRHMKTIRIISGLFLVAIGILIALGRFQQLTGWFARTGIGMKEWAENHPTASTLLWGLIPIFTGALPSLTAFIRKKRERIITVGKIIFFILLAVPGLLELLGVINIPALLGDWFTYQGI
jgi:cytochrome c-type biogenesis protein